MGKQIDISEPVQPKDAPNPVFCLQLFSDFFYCFIFVFQCQAWVWCFPCLSPCSPQSPPLAVSQAAVTQGGWAELAITLLSFLVHLSIFASPILSPHSTHKCPCWQSPLAEGAKGGQLCAKAIVEHPALSFPSWENPLVLCLGWAGQKIPCDAPSHCTRICLCPCPTMCKNGHWMVAAKWVSHSWFANGFFFM